MGYSGSYDKSLIDLSFSHDDIFLVGMPSFLALLAAACVNASFEPLKIKSKSLIFINISARKPIGQLCCRWEELPLRN